MVLIISKQLRTWPLSYKVIYLQIWLKVKIQLNNVTEFSYYILYEAISSDK